ncbi:MAG: glycoside hydrolase family 88 protein [Candidatus Pseudobacter hemicellulosilyticus]|uniref:Glycoside hydrolase family 88 protein n=1 Tax=Candidatus Pseudobacter hemicellulosilyticus TaxID=3121375 RepID=A0AAJ5X1B5_9BACT|nr:MAG: glycoside hydrolase family 88 protein [Pseudobacter sp.]
MQTKHSFWGNVNSQYTADHITYPDVCAWLGACWFTKTIKNEELYRGLVNRFEPLFTTEKHLQPDLNTTADNKVDYYVFGAVPLELYTSNKESRFKDLGMKYADGQWTLPSKATQAQKDWYADGYSWQTRLWIDDMFMITSLQAQAYLATGDEKYIERTAKEMVLYLDRLQRPNGLFYHAPNAPYYWARGNGWMAVGMAEMLRILPKEARYTVYRERIMKGYQDMMATLLRYQMADGMWGQLIDNLSAWKETSGSAMFTYAMITGVKNGWLDKEKYGIAARKAWLALLTYLDTNYDISNVCEGTGAQNNYQYYLDRRRWTGDLHGQAALLWCANALVRPANKN